MEAGDNSAPPLSASERQLQALTANIQELARQSAADRREMQELAKQNQELMALLRSRGEIPSPGQGQNGEEIPHNETGRNQNQNHNQNDEGSSANQNREPHPPPHPSQVADPAKSAADVRAAKLEEELKEMREQMKEMKSQVKAKAAKNLDMLVHRSESPFTKRIDEYPLPTKFKVPQLETFDGFKDPLDYLDSFRTIMRLHGVSDEIMCRTFPTNLRGSARTWFNQLETGSIDTFRPREGESLRSYVQRFNKEAVQIDEPNEYVALTAFNAGLLKGDFLFQLCKDPPKSMSELMYEAQKFINAEDAFQARDEFLSRKRKEPEDRRFDSSRNKSSRQDYPKAERKNISSSNRREERPSSFTPLNMSIDQVLLQIQDNPDIQWPGKLRSDPTKRSKDLYCRFHRDHGHTTEDCFALKQQIEALIRQGKLGKFVRQDKTEVRHEPRPPRQDENKDRQEDRPRDIIGEIRTIVGGLASGGASRSSRKAYARQAHNILVTQRSRKSLKMDDQVISFSEDDARNIHHPHDDALVVTLTIAGFLTRRVLVDNGSSADIIYLPAYQQMKIDKEQLKPIDIPLVGFTGDKVKPLGVVSLVIEAGTYPRQVRTSVEFLVEKLKGDQATARECYFASLGPEATHQTMKIDEGHKLVEPTEEVGGDSVGRRTSQVKPPALGQKWTRTIREAMISFLKSNLDVFAWTHDDMPGIDPATICHKLNLPPASNRPTCRLDSRTPVANLHGCLLRSHAVRIEERWSHLPATDEQDVPPPDRTKHGGVCRRYAGENEGRYKALGGFERDVRNPPSISHEAQPEQMCLRRFVRENSLGFMVSQRGIEANPDKDKSRAGDDSLQGRRKKCKASREEWRHFNRFVSRATDKCLPFFKTLRKAFVWTDECQESFRRAQESPRQLSAQPSSGKTGAPNCQCTTPVKLFQGAEERYPAMEKLALALVIAARKLRPYFQSHKIIVLTNHPLQQKPDEEWEVEIDGSSVKGAGGVGIVFKDTRRDIYSNTPPGLQYPTTNNEAEGQVNGEYEAREDRMAKYLKLVRNAMEWFDEVMLVQVPREQNTEADALAKLASSDEATDQYIEVQHSPSHLEEELSPINVSNSWMTPIINYLEDETLPSDPVEARKLKVRCTRFVLIQGILYKAFLYKRGFSLPYLRCLDKAEADYVMREVHEGICGNHSGARSLVHKLVRAGYYWPTMQKDVVSYVRACDKCQRFGNLIHSPPETLTPMTAPWPFAQWGLDIMGPLPVGRRQLKFLVVGIDYFTKWVEAEPLATITEKNIRGFVWKAIICRFGIPRAFISDNGRQFDNSPFREFCEELGIHNHYSSPGHPQANGQVEVTNRSLLKMIKTRLEGAKGLWPEELPNILWAYRTTARTPTGETPFRLTYGTEAVIPVEVGLTTWRTNNYDEVSNDAQLRSNLDLVDEVRDQAEARTRVYQQRMARYYDRRVKHREFKVGDLVLRKVTLATKDPTQGKLGPTWEGPYRVVKFHRRGTYHLEKLDGNALPHPWNAEHLKKYYQ
uniref:Integrase catalytic domain-containing protein n=1 Tax=Fagus sylvatica TaxID=28930 RepID=A0A2N9EQ75_FAGSY